MGVYPWLFTGYLLYDTYAMFMCETRKGSQRSHDSSSDLLPNGELQQKTNGDCATKNGQHPHNAHGNDVDVHTKATMLELITFLKQNKMMMFHHLVLPSIFLPVVAVSGFS